MQERSYFPHMSLVSPIASIPACSSEITVSISEGFIAGIIVMAIDCSYS